MISYPHLHRLYQSRTFRVRTETDITGRPCYVVYDSALGAVHSFRYWEQARLYRNKLAARYWHACVRLVKEQTA